MSKSREQLNQLLKAINIQDKIVLDVGVQDKPTSRLTHGTPREEYTLDIDDQWDPDVVADLNDDFGSIVARLPNKLMLRQELPNVIFCIEVLEHCWNPVKVCENLAKLLQDGGKLYLSTPFINPHHDYVDYLRFTHEWFRDVLPKVGFKDVIIKERVATVGKPFLENFYKTEGLKISKIRPEYGRYTYPIGYFVEATKI